MGVSFLALLALALVPAILERQEAVLERELAVLSLARPMFREVQVVLSQERTSIEQYLSLGDSSSLEIYQDNASREGELFGNLRGVIGGMPSRYQAELAQVQLRANEWRVLLSPLIEEGPLSTDSVVARENMEDHRARHDSVQFAVRDFEDRLIRDAALAESRLERLRTWQFWATGGAIALAVVGAIAMVFVGVSLQNLARGETRR
ncbi:MAG: hypothetical protein V3T24_11960, partial [Longimicrobiales bacterium]